MDEPQALSFGKYLRRRRQQLRLSTHEVARRAGFNQTTVVRLEQGSYLSPAPDKLRRIAEVLDLNLADVLSLAGYPMPTELPSPLPYLRTKFRNMPASELDALSRDIAEVFEQYGIDPASRPLAAEDETDPFPYNQTGGTR